MNQPQFTHGEWKAHKRTTAYDSGAEGAWEIHYSDDGECVAEIVHEEADARLFAASKELFAALTECRAWFESTGHVPGLSEKIESALSAAASAESPAHHQPR